MAVFKTKFSGLKKGNVAQRTIQGVDLLVFDVKVPAAAKDSDDEQILLYKFPDDGDCFLIRNNAEDLRIDIPVDGLDTGASVGWKLGVGDSDGVIDTALIATGIAGNSTLAFDVLDAAAKPLNVSGKYLIFDMTAAPAAAVTSTNTMSIAAKVAFGKKVESDTAST